MREVELFLKVVVEVPDGDLDPVVYVAKARDYVAFRLPRPAGAVLRFARVVAAEKVEDPLEHAAAAVEALPEGTWGDFFGARSPWPVAAEAIRALKGSS